MDKKTKVLFVLRFMLHYRVDLFQRIADKDSIDFTLFHGRGLEKSKFVNYDGPVTFKHKELKTWRYRSSSKVIMYYPTLFRELIRLNPDIIITEGESNMPNNVIIYLYSRLYRKKTVWWGLGLIPGYKETLFQKIYKPFMRLFLKKVSNVIGYSEYARDYYSKFTDRSRIVVANNCLDNERIDKEIMESREDAIRMKKEMNLDDKFVILFVGAFTQPKKIDKLIRAFAMIKKDHPEAVLMIVGDGKIRQGFENLVSSLDLKDVLFIGTVIEGISKYFLMADLFVLPGLGGLSIHHAMIHSLPVISASADGTERDLIKDNFNGYLLKTDTVEELAGLIELFLKDRTLSKKFGLRSREIVDSTINIANKVRTFQNVCEQKT